jgi:hypothetical protein
VDRTKIDNAAHGRRPSDVDKRLKRRIIVYLFAIVVLYGIWHESSPPSSPPPTSATQSIDDIDRVDTPVEPLPPNAHIDPALLAGVRDESPAERAFIERDAQAHLLQESAKLAYGDLVQLGIEEGDWERLSQDPGSARGKPFWVLGELKQLNSEVVDRLVYSRGIVEDQDGRPWAFMVITEPWKIELGDIVKVSGFFLKIYDMAQPDGQFVRMPLLIGDELLASAYRISPVTQLREDLFDTVRDRDLAQASRPLESTAFYELLSYVKNANPDELFPPDDPTLETMPHHLLQNPEAWRGRPVELTGVLMYMKEAPLGPRGENPLDDPFVWQLWVADTRSGDTGTMLVMCLDKPEGIAEGDIVDVQGVFFRRYSFENKANSPRMAAVVPAHSVTKFTPGEDTLNPILMKVIISIVSAIVVLVAFGQWRERRGAKLVRSDRMARKRRMVETVSEPRAPPVVTEITRKRRKAAPAAGKTPPQDEEPRDSEGPPSPDTRE